MPDWNPLIIGLLVGIICGGLWSTRVVINHLQIAGVWMFIEVRFWRSLFTGFGVCFTLFGLLASLIAGLLWVVLGVL